MLSIRRRHALLGAAASPLASPAIVRAQSRSQPIKIGILSDLSGQYSDMAGPGYRVATDLAIQDFGGSVLGRPIEVLQADGQNKADIAGPIVREWIDTQGVDVLADGAATSSASAVQQVCREKKRVYLITGAASSDLTGRLCSPYGIHFVFDTYALAHATGFALTKSGGDSWFFITADYAFGSALQRDASSAVVAGGGKVLGSVRAPLGTADFSTYLIQAQASGASVIALANAGADLQNCIKQAAEFGVTRGNARLAVLVMQITDVIALDPQTRQGLIYTDSFYWDMSDAARAWSKRYMAKRPLPPSQIQAGGYCATTHWLKAVRQAGTTDADTVVAAMKAMPVNDMYNNNVSIREDGRVMHELHLWQVKSPAEAKYPFDLSKQVATIAPESAWRPLHEGGCPLING